MHKQIGLAERFICVNMTTYTVVASGYVSKGQSGRKVKSPAVLSIQIVFQICFQKYSTKV